MKDHAVRFSKPRMRMHFPWLMLLAISIATGCGGAGAEKAAIDELKEMGALVLLENGRASSAVLAKTSAKEVDIDAALPLVAKLGKLESLVLNGTQITDDQLKIVGSMRSLGDLQLSDTGISDAGIKHLTGLSNLTSIYISGTKVTGACLSDISKLKKLSTVGINNTAVAGGYEALQGLDGLVLLVAGQLSISEEDAAAIAEIPNLKRLDIKEATVSPEALETLRKGVEDVGY